MKVVDPVKVMSLGHVQEKAVEGQVMFSKSGSKYMEQDSCFAWRDASYVEALVQSLKPTLRCIEYVSWCNESHRGSVPTVKYTTVLHLPLYPYMQAKR